MCMCINELASWAGCACWLGLAGWAGWAGLHAGLLVKTQRSIVACIFKHISSNVMCMFAHMCSMQSIHPEAANIHNSQLRE